MSAISEIALRRILTSEFPGFTIDRVEVVSTGTDTVYRVAGTHGGTDRTLIFKTPGRNHVDAFRAEPFIQQHVAATTDLPIADVYTVDLSTDELDTPYFIMEALPGDHPTSDWGVDALTTSAREMGTALGTLHTAFTFDVPGEVRSSEADPLSVDTWSSWPEYLDVTVQALLDDVADQFADYAPRIRAYYDQHRDALPTDGPWALLHGDYRFQNVLFDGPTAPSLTGILDWGRVYTGDPAYNVERTAYFLARECDTDAAATAVTDAFRDGYDATVDHPWTPSSECATLYQLHTMAVELKWFDDWYADWPAADRTARRETIVDTLDQLLADDA